MKRISICDITMSVSAKRNLFNMSFREKIEISHLLDKLSVAVIQTAPILNTTADALLVKSIANAVTGSTISVPVDILDPTSVETAWNALKLASHPRLQVSAPTSTVGMEYICHKKPDAIIGLVSSTVASCRKYCNDVEFDAMDFSRADDAFLKEIITAAVEAGATIVNLTDSEGGQFPHEFYSQVSRIKEYLPENVRLGISCSNDFFLADACAAASLHAGVDEIKAMPFGSWTVSLKRLVAMLGTKSHSESYSSTLNLSQFSTIIPQIRRICLPDRARTSAVFSKQENGRVSFILNETDTKEDVLKAASALGYELESNDADSVYDEFLKIVSKNGSITAKELESIIASNAFSVPPTYMLESYVINSGNKISATSHVVLRKGSELLESVCLGDGPIDAAFLAIEKIAGCHYELDDFQIQSVTEGREAMGETLVRLRHDGKIYSGRGTSTDIVGSSILAYVSALNKIAYEEL